MTDYYTCRHCGDLRSSYGCDAKRGADLKTHWGIEYAKDLEAASTTERLLAAAQLHPTAQAAIQRVLKLADQSIAQHRRFAGLEV